MGKPGQVVVRAETPSDYDQVRRVVEDAFGRENEARLVELIRASENYIPELALVAEHEGAVIGYILFSYATLEGADRLRVLALAPVAVASSHQRTGVGSALVEEGLARSDARGEPLVVVLGHAAYYPRFGFRSARQLGIEPPSPAIPDPVFMVKTLGQYSTRYRGRIVYPPPFDVA